MNKYFFLIYLMLIAISCKTNTNEKVKSVSFNKNKTYILRLNPAAESHYYYDISNELDMKLEINDKTIARLNKTKIGVSYFVNKDSAGNFLFTTIYDKVKIYSKNDDTETELDAANAPTSTNPVEKMLGTLKNTKIVTSVNRMGEVKIVSGYDELSRNVIQELKAFKTDMQTKVKAQLDQFIERGIVKNNMSQLSAIFPDSAVHIGDKWKLRSKQNEDLGLNVDAVFTLEDINNGIASITSVGIIKSDSSVTTVMGQMATGNLNGKQHGEYEMDIKTGMLVKSNITANVEGIIQMMSREIPVKVESSINMNGKKIQ